MTAQLVAEHVGSRRGAVHAFRQWPHGDRDRWWEPREVLGTFIDGRPRGEALTASHEYSNTNYLLLGLVIERVAGEPLHDVIRRELAERLGLTSTVLPHADWARPGHLAAAWSPGVFRGDPREPYASFESAAWAAGAVVSTAADLATLIDALFDDAFLDLRRRRES